MLADLLTSAARKASADHRPHRVFSLVDGENADLQRLLESDRVSAVHGLSDETVLELAEMRRPMKTHDDAARADFVDGIRRQGPDYGAYVAFDDLRGGWEIVHYPSEEDYIDLLHWRHSGRIPDDWKSTHYHGVTGFVAGLSVGSSIAFSLARAGVARRMLIADSDILSPSNLGRTPYDVRHVGHRKTSLASDVLARINPYLDIVVMADGYSRDAEAQLAELSPDFIVEEVDNPECKALIEHFGREHRIPLFTVADMQNAVLEIRRHDTETAKPFGGRVSEDDYRLLLSGKCGDDERMQIMIRIVGRATVLKDSELIASFMDPGSGGFPQLIEIVSAGAALTTSAIVATLDGRGPSSGMYTYSPNKILGLRHRFPLKKRFDIARAFVKASRASDV